MTLIIKEWDGEAKMNDEERFYLFLSGVLALLGLHYRGYSFSYFNHPIRLEEIKRFLGWKRKQIQETINYYEEKRPDHIFDFSASPLRRYYHTKNDRGIGVSLITLRMVPQDYIEWRKKGKLQLKLRKERK